MSKVWFITGSSWLTISATSPTEMRVAVPHGRSIIAGTGAGSRSHRTCSGRSSTSGSAASRTNSTGATSFGPASAEERESLAK
jgi:hypothetical protein